MMISTLFPVRERPGVERQVVRLLPWVQRELQALMRPLPSTTKAPHYVVRLNNRVIVASASALALLTRVALSPAPHPLDVRVTRFLQRAEPPLLTRAMTLLSAPGFAPLQHALTVGTALDMWALGHRREALFTMLTMGAGATTGILKRIVNRPRPDAEFMRKVLPFRDKSFPSGHCTHYASFYGFMFYLAATRMSPSLLRTVIMSGCVSLITLVAPSRIYLGHHWTSDTLAGDLVGLTYLFALIEVYETIGVRGRSLRPGNFY